MIRPNVTFFAMTASMLGALAVAGPVVTRTTVESEQKAMPAPAAAKVKFSERSDLNRGPYRVLKDYLGLTDRQAYEDWRGRIDPRRGQYTTETLIAILPEPLAPALQYKFDTYLDAVQRAAESAEYLPDRFDLPWGDQNSKGDAAGSSSGDKSKDADSNAGPTAISPEQPGVLLFRKVSPNEHKLLLVFVVGENPVWGVRKEALVTSLNWIAWLANSWGSLPPNFPRSGDIGPPHIRILGPSFTGSAESLRLVLGGWLASNSEDLPNPSIQVISGSATSIKASKNGMFPENWGFRTTAISAADKKELTEGYLEKVLKTSEERIASLSESGTTFGFGSRNPPTEDQKSTQAPAKSDTKKAATRSTLTLEFPLHISDLRSQMRSKSAAATAQLELGHKDLSLAEDTSSAGAYVVPIFSTRSAMYDELVLNKLLDSIYTARMDYVRIAAATDVEDLIFLAQQIRKNCPNTVLVTSTADIRFLHTEVNPDLRGMLTFSTYPLFLANQSWSPPFLGESQRTQFASDNAEGIYNAALALLGVRDKLLDYSSPFKPGTLTPPMWVSIVGNDNFWPVAMISDLHKYGKTSGPSLQKPQSDEPYLFVRTPQRAEVPKQLPSAMYPRPFLFGFVILSLLCIGASISLIGGNPVIQIPLVSRGLRRLLDSIPRSLAMFYGDVMVSRNVPPHRTILLQYSLIVLFLQAMVYGFFILPMVRLTVFGSDAANWNASAFAQAIFVIGSISLGMTVVAAITTFCQALAKPASPFRRMYSIVSVALMGVATFSVANLIGISTAVDDKIERTFLFLRSVDLGNSVSPLLPMLLLAGAGLQLIICSLRRFNLLQECPVPSPFLNFGDRSFNGVSRLEERIVYLLESKWWDLPAACFLLPFVIIALVTALFRGRLSYPVDGLWFDIAVRGSALLIYTAFTIVFLRFVVGWRALRTLLRRLYWHPTRRAYEALRASLPGEESERKRIVTLEPRPSYTAVEASLQCARTIAARTNAPLLDAAIHAAEASLSEAYSAENDPTVRGAEKIIAARQKTAEAMSRVASEVTSIFDSEWRQQETKFRLTDETQELNEKLTEQANLFVAARVVDFIRQIVPQLHNLAVFGTAGMLLMLLALSSYPFPQRDSFLWLSWATFLTAVVLLSVVFVQMNRDRIFSLLHGTIPGKLNWDSTLVNQIILFVVVPALSLLGAQFPDTFRELITWASKVGTTAH